MGEPKRREYVEFRVRPPAIACGDRDQNVVGRRLGILDQNVEVTVVGKDASVKEFIFKFLPTAARVRLHEVIVWVCALRVLVKILHVRVSRGVIQVEVVFLYILAMIAFLVGETEHAFLQNGVMTIPEGKGETQALLLVGYASN